MQFLVFFGALLASAVLTRCVRDFSNAREWNALPSSDRHIHTRRIPRLGGVAIFATLWAMVLATWVAGRFGVHGLVFPVPTFKILGPATIIFVVGLIDDFCGLGPYVKFVAQAGAAILLFCSGFGISQVSLLRSHPHLGWLVGLPLTILWVLWITNAFNLIDGLDGLAAGSALFATLVTWVMAILFHNDGIVFLTLALAGGIAGFLRYNFNPASIFLGDCGSLLIGFLLSAIALAGSQKAPTAVAVAIPVLSFGLPILDVAVAVIRRFLGRQRLFEADREHIHHKLLRRGVSHREAVLTLYGVSACFGLLSLLLLHGRLGAITVMVVLGIGVLVGVHQLRYPEFFELGRAANRTWNQRQVIANDLSIRRAADAVRSSADAAQFCQILQQYLKPIGFDGFSLDLLSELPAGVEVFPLKHSDKSKLHFFWDPSAKSTDADWGMSFGLTKENGEALGRFCLYRRNAATPLWMDLDVFTLTGFCTAVAAVVDRMPDSWSAGSVKERRRIPRSDSVRPVMVARIRQLPGLTNGRPPVTADGM